MMGQAVFLTALLVAALHTVNSTAEIARGTENTECRMLDHAFQNSVTVSYGSGYWMASLYAVKPSLY